MEAILAARGSVAGTGIAAGLREDGHDVAAKADRRLEGRVRDRYRNYEIPAIETYAQFGFAVGERCKDSFIEPSQFPVCQFATRLQGDIPREAVGVAGLHDNRLAGFGGG